MAKLKATRKGTQVTTGKVRLSYPTLFEPKSVTDGGEKKYSAVFLIPKDDEEQVEVIKAAIEEAKEMAKSTKFGGTIPKNLKVQWHDGDEESDAEEYKGHYFINTYASRKPKLVDRRSRDITDPEDLYAGCYVRAAINFYSYNVNSKGIACGLNGVQFIEDGEPLSGGHVEFDALDDFDDMADDFLD